MLDGFFHAVVSHIVGRRLGAHDEMITDVLFDEAMAVVAADNRVGQLDVFDHGLQLAAVELGELATEDGGDLIGLADGAIGIEQSLAETVQGGTTAEDKIVAVFDFEQRTADADSRPRGVPSG
jgi:hypothetical protein